MRRILVLVVGGLLLVTACGSSGGDSSAPAEAATPATAKPTTTTKAEYVPTAADFSVEVIELERSCFGSAGCNVTYTIDPVYLGAQLPDPSKTYTVIYSVNGTEDPKTGSFTLSGGRMSFQEQDFVSTPEGAPTLTATPTRVLDR